MMVESTLLQFLKHDIKMFKNYQPIIIKMLLESKNYITTIPEIKNKFQELNFDRGTFIGTGERPLGHSAIDSVKKVFSDGKLISFPEGTSQGDVKLIDNEINESEIKECLKICGEKILNHHLDELMTRENQCYFIQAGIDGKYFKEFKENKFVAVDYLDEDDPVGNFDLTGMSKDDIINKNGTDKYATELFHVSQIKPGDIIAVTTGNKSVEEFAIATSDYYFENSATENKHRVNIEYLNFGTTEINKGSVKAIILDKSDKIQNFLTKDSFKYFLLRHSKKDKKDQKWEDEIGKKYHVGRYGDGRMGHNVQTILDAKIGSKAVWISNSIDKSVYILGYGSIKSIETINEDKDWNVIFENFTKFGNEESSQIIGKKMNSLILNEIQELKKDSKINWEHSISVIPKKLYRQMIGEDLTSEEEQIDSMNQGNFNPKLEKLYEILKRKKQIIFYGPPGTGKTYSANELKKYILSKNTPQPISSNSQNWIFVTSPEHLEILRTKKVWGSIAKLTSIKEKIHSGDKVIFYVKGEKSFKSSFEFVGDWYPAESGIWTDESSKDYQSQIDLKELEHFDVDLSILKETEVYKTKLDSGRYPENKIIPLMLQASGGFPANDSSSISESDYKKICSLTSSIGSSINDQNFSKNVTFHQSYSYEDFVEGIRPDITSSDKVIYKPQDGIFKEICESARKDPQNNYVLTIDEINRGNVSKIFGELITLIESDKRKEEHKVTLPYTRQSFWIPKNLFIIGTMNTADRSIAQLDTALRRRFAFEELMPEYTLQELEKSIDNISLKDLLSTLNSRIRAQGPQFRDKQIGHSYFMDDCKNIEDLRTIFAVEIIPLLQDYFYHDYKKLEEKILNSDFIEGSKDEIKPEWKNDDEIFKAAINKILTSN